MNINGEQLVACIQSIVDFNIMGGNKEHELDITLEQKMVKSEIKEFLDAYQTNDQKEMMDAEADVLVVWIGTIWKAGHLSRLVDVLKSVCESNMTKFCKTLDEAKATVDFYKDLGVETHHSYNDQYKLFVVKDNKGKIMKSINFQKPAI